MLSKFASLTRIIGRNPFFSATRSFAEAITPEQETIYNENQAAPELLPKYAVLKDLDYNSLEKKPKSEESIAFNKEDFQAKHLLKFDFRRFKRPHSLELIQEIELFVFSKTFDDVCCPTKLVCSKFSLFCLHYWLLQNRLSQTWSLSSWRARKSVEKLLNDYIKDSVYSFQDYFDRDVYAELLRIKRTQFFALDDYFVYEHKDKPLSQIVTEDILLDEYDEESPMIQHLEEYIENHVKYLNTLSVAEIQKNHIFWGLQPCVNSDAS